MIETKPRKLKRMKISFENLLNGDTNEIISTTMGSTTGYICEGKNEKRRIFLEPRVVLADPTKGVRFLFEIPSVEVDGNETGVFPTKWHKLFYEVP